MLTEGRALGRCQRRGALVVSHRAPAARPPRGRAHRAHLAARVPLRDSGRALEQARAAGAILGDSVYRKFPFAGATAADGDRSGEAILNRTWRPFLSVVGADGLPAIKDAGNVLRPKTALKLSLRIPPLIDGQQATRELKRILEADPPHGAKVSFEADQGATGWSAPPTAPWLLEAAGERVAGLLRPPRR